MMKVNPSNLARDLYRAAKILDIEMYSLIALIHKAGDWSKLDREEYGTRVESDLKRLLAKLDVPDSLLEIEEE